MHRQSWQYHLLSLFFFNEVDFRRYKRLVKCKVHARSNPWIGGTYIDKKEGSDSNLTSMTDAHFTSGRTSYSHYFKKILLSTSLLFAIFFDFMNVKCYLKIVQSVRHQPVRKYCKIFGLEHWLVQPVYFNYWCRFYNLNEWSAYWENRVVSCISIMSWVELWLLCSKKIFSGWSKCAFIFHWRYPKNVVNRCMFVCAIKIHFI